MRPIVKGRRIDPSSSAMEMTTRHIDDNNKVWPRGTVYEPMSAGSDRDGRYQEITINGERVFFTEHL